MNTRRFSVTCLVVATLVLAVPLHAQTIKIATVAPEGSSWMSDMRAAAAEIKERTDGRVIFKYYAGGVQGNEKQVQRKMRTGQLHGGAFTSGALSGFQPDADMLALAMLFDTLEEASMVRAELEPELRQRIEDAGYANFGFAAAGFAYMMSNQPISTLDDMRGLKIWTPEGDVPSYSALEALGVSPVTLPITDVMTGLQTDLLDSVSVPPVGAVVFQWHTRLKYITELPVAYVYASLLIDKKVFSRLSDEDQVIVREVMERTYDSFDENGTRDNAEAFAALLDSGLELVTTNDDEVNQWRDVVFASHRKLAGDGLFDLSLLDRIQELLAAYRNGSENAAP